MNKIIDKVELMALKMKEELSRLVNEERGDIGVKQLAITVGVIIVIGAVVAVLTGKMDGIVTDVWDWLFIQLKELTGNYN